MSPGANPAEKLHCLFLYRLTNRSLDCHFTICF